MEPNEIYIDGIGKVNKSEWIIVMNSDDTFLLASLEDQELPKLWVTADEWEGKICNQQ